MLQKPKLLVRVDRGGKGGIKGRRNGKDEREAGFLRWQ